MPGDWPRIWGKVMWSKNKPAPLTAEREHIERVKALPCAVCGASGPSDAHHIEQRLQWAIIPLCRDCHQGGVNGLHGQRRMWIATKATELGCLNDTIGILMNQTYAPSRKVAPVRERVSKLTRPSKIVPRPNRGGAN